MAVEFKCPSCAGDLSVKRGEKTTRCPYCGSSVLVPESLQEPEPPQIIQSTVTVSGSGTGRRMASCILTAAVLVVMGTAAMVYLLVSAVESVPEGVSLAGGPEVILRFGSEGTGTGSFTDPRHVAVDGEGNIYVAEYETGRIQVFDSSGGFLAQWFAGGADGDVYPAGMDVSADGVVHLVHHGHVALYEGMTGRSLGSLGSVTGFEDVYLPGDGMVLATLWSAGDELYRFGPDGGVDLHLVNAVQGVTGDPELAPMVAGDGLGNIYILGTFNSSVFVFDRNGNYQNMFGSDGDEPGQFRAPSDIAVDGFGRVFISDFGGVQVFDGTGRYLGLMDVPSQGFVYGMDFTPEGNLCLVTGGFEVLTISPFWE